MSDAHRSIGLHDDLSQHLPRWRDDPKGWLTHNHWREIRHVSDHASIWKNPETGSVALWVDNKVLRADVRSANGIDNVSDINRLADLTRTAEGIASGSVLDVLAELPGIEIH